MPYSLNVSASLPNQLALLIHCSWNYSDVMEFSTFSLLYLLWYQPVYGMDSQNIWCTISINTQKKGGARYHISNCNRYLLCLGDNWLFTCLLVHGYRGSRGSSWCRFECFENLRRICWWRSTEAYTRRTQVRNQYQKP